MKKQENVIIGIYKITNPNGKIYIGQSTNIYRRWKQYLSSPKSYIGQVKLYNSLQKYNPDNHIFEITEECNIEQLDEREIYWGLQYDVLSDNGLNLKLGLGKGIFSLETKNKMSISIKGKKLGKESKGSGRVKGFTVSEETRQKQREAKLGKNSNHKGYKDSEETLFKKSIAKLGKPSNKKGKTYGKYKPRKLKTKTENISQ